MQLITDALAAYGATLGSYGEIIRNGKPTGVTVDVKGRRIRFCSLNTLRLLVSGPISTLTVENFVERFWYWSKA